MGMMMAERGRWLVARWCERVWGLWVVLDGEDGTVTVSRGMYVALVACGEDRLDKVHVCRMGKDGNFAVMMDPWRLRGTKSNYYPLQYASRWGCVGFQPSTPTVALMLGEMGVRADEKVRCGVRVRWVKGEVVYEIMGK